MGGLDFARNALARIGTPASSPRPRVRGGGGDRDPARAAGDPGRVHCGVRAGGPQPGDGRARAGNADHRRRHECAADTTRTCPRPSRRNGHWWRAVARSRTSCPIRAAMPPWSIWTWPSRTGAGRPGWRWSTSGPKKCAASLSPALAGFTGRHRALADITRWLDDPAERRPMIVTGDPGSGKTAVLGLLAALADPHRRPTVPRDGLPAGCAFRARTRSTWRSTQET